MLHVSDGLNISDTNFLHNKNYIRRAGIIPFLVDENKETFILLGKSKEQFPVWADLGGRSEEGETVLQTAIREFGEESRYVIPVHIEKVTKILVTNGNPYSDSYTKLPDQCLLVMEVPLNSYYLNINEAFQKTVPTTQYEDEMSELVWFPYDYFLQMDGLSKSMQQIQKLLANL